jgi:hypothetical protein
MCHPDGATKHVQKVFLTHARLQSRPDEIADELFCRLFFMARFDLVNIGISWTSWNMTLYIFELTFQRCKACSNPKLRTLDMAFLVNIVRTKFRWHCRRGSREFLFIELVRTGLQTRLQTRLSEKIEFFERLDGLSFRPSGGTFDHHFVYQITPTRTYIYKTFSIYI